MYDRHRHISESVPAHRLGQRANYPRILARWLGWVGLVSLILVATLAHTQARQSTSNRAGLVVQFGDGRVETACVELGADGTATGLEVLLASGLDVQATDNQSNRAAVCKIEEDGCNRPGNTCFCQCNQSEETCNYWAYFHLENGNWQYGGITPSSYTVQPGAVEGWAWGEGTLGRSGTEPPIRTFEEICQDGSGQQSTQPAAEPGILTCPVGETIMIAGTGPSNTALVLYFAEQPVGGGFSNAEGSYQIPLVISDTQPGNYLVEVQTRVRRDIIGQAICQVPDPTE
jgi:hypothetical protein